MATVFFAAALSLALSAAIRADTIAVEAGEVDVVTNGLCSLREALLNANADSQVSADCPAGNGLDTVVLPADALFELTDSYQDGNGLPILDSAILIEGNSSTIQRAESFPCSLSKARGPTDFRLLEVQFQGNVTVNDLAFRNGCASGTGAPKSGGAIAVNAGTLVLNRVLVENNQARGFSGGLDTGNGAVVTIRNSIFRSNFGRKGAGAIGNGHFCELRIYDSEISNNVADGLGGGGIGNFGDLELVNTTVSDNVSSLDAGGVGIGPRNASFGTARISMSTIANNSASRDGSNLGSSGFVRIKNSIVADAPVGVDCFQTSFNTLAEDQNFDTDGTCAAIDPRFSQVTTADLALGPLSGGEGPATLPLGSTSVARDAVTDCSAVDGIPVAADQRGVPRPQGVACDVGAFEFVEAIFMDGFESGDTSAWAP